MGELERHLRCDVGPVLGRWVSMQEMQTGPVGIVACSNTDIILRHVEIQGYIYENGTKKKNKDIWNLRIGRDTQGIFTPRVFAPVGMNHGWLTRTGYRFVYMGFIC